MSATVTAPALRDSRRPARRIVAWAAVGAVATLLVTLVARPVLDDRSPTAPSPQAAVSDYRADVEPILEDGASVVALGLKPGVADVARRTLGHDVLVTMADGWVRSLEAVRTDLEALSPSAALDDVHWLYVRSLDTYVLAAKALRAAVDAEVGARLDALVDLAAQLGTTADQLYDKAESSLDRLDDSTTE